MWIVRPLPCGRIPSHPLSMFRYCLCAVRSHHKNKEQVCWNSSYFTERYLIINSRIKEAAALNMLSHRINCWKNINKKRKTFFHLIKNIVSSSTIAWKTESFSGKISWRWTWSQISRKFNYGENLLLFWMMWNKAFAYLYTLGNNIYTRKNSGINIYMFMVNNSNTRRRCEHVQS